MYGTAETWRTRRGGRHFDSDRDFGGVGVWGIGRGGQETAEGGGGYGGNGGRGLHSSTSQLNLTRFGHTSPSPPSDTLGGHHAPNLSHKMCLR
jgi:hypothetical protein